MWRLGDCEYELLLEREKQLAGDGEGVALVSTLELRMLLLLSDDVCDVVVVVVVGVEVLVLAAAAAAECGSSGDALGRRTGFHV